jgi:hypothetical protein
MSIINVRSVFFSEVVERAQYGVWRRPTQVARSYIFDLAGKVFEKFDIPLAALPLTNPLEDLTHPFSPRTTGREFSAGFVLAEVHEAPCHVHHAGVFIDDVHAS